MSLLGKLKDLVIVNEAADQHEQPDRATAAAQPAVPSAEIPATTSGPALSGTPAESANLEKQIDGEIRGNPAFAPFATFIRMSENMKNKVPDEAQRYQAVQAATESTLETLLAAVNSRSDVLKREATNFNSSLVRTTEAEIASLTGQEKQLEQQIAALSAQISTLSARKEELSRQAITHKSNLDKLRIDFDAACEAVDRRYRDYAAKLQNYLGATRNGQ